MFRVKLMRTRDIDRLDLRIGAELLDGFVSCPAEIPDEAPSRIAARISGCNETDFGVLHQARPH
jgi:hypothetical protein